MQDGDRSSAVQRRWDEVLSTRRGALVAVLLIAALAASKLPGVPGEFVSWDDDRFIENNRFIHGFSLANAKEVFSKQHFEAYHPLHLASYWIDYSLFGLWAPGYKALNFCLYLLCLFLAFRLLLRLGLPPTASLLGVAVLAAHPLHVEPVVWATARKETLSLAFFLGAMLAHIRASEQAGARRWRAAAMLLFLCALLSKTSTIVLPLLVVLTDVVLRGHSLRAAIRKAAPLLVVALVVGVYVVRLWGSQSMIRPTPDTAVAHASLVLKTIWHSVSKIFVPVDLSPVYPIDRAGALDYRTLLGVLVVLALGFVLVRGKSWPRYAAGWFVLAMIPVSNIVPVYFFVQDRYSFIPSLALGIGVAAIASTVRRHGIGWPRIALVSLLAVVPLAGVSVVQSSAWRSSLSLWRVAADHQPLSYYAHLGLGHALRQEKRYDDAIASYKKAIRLRPAASAARLSYCLATVSRDRGERGMGPAEQALRRAWLDAGALLRMSSHWLSEKMPVCAAVAEGRAFELVKPSARSLLDAASRWVVGGQWRQALRHLDRIPKGDARNPAYDEITAQALVLKGDEAAARRHMARSLRRAPRKPGALTKTATAFEANGQPALAAFYRSFVP